MAVGNVQEKEKARLHRWRAFFFIERANRLIGCTKRKTPPSISSTGFFYITSLTITYFHTGCSTIIGAKSFHGPVRDGKGWDRLAMVIRHNLYERRSRVERAQNLEEVKFR
jgi:hypothetical protein